MKKSLVKLKKMSGVVFCINNGKSFFHIQNATLGKIIGHVFENADLLEEAV